MNTLPSKILIATGNQGKVDEIRDLVKGLSVRFLSLADAGGISDFVEDGETFEENALKKARIISSTTGMVTLADDSGLCIDALHGGPGVLSARYSGEAATDEEKCRAILRELQNVPDDLRSARFECVLALVDPGGEERVFRGVCEGRITRELRGTGGFGYDPIFYFPEAHRTFAEMDREWKNRVSHRGRALRQFVAFLERLQA